MSISPRHITEEVLKSFLQSQPELANMNIYTGDGEAVMEMPRIIVICESANSHPQIPRGLGNYLCNVSVKVCTLSSGVGGLGFHRATCALVAGYLQDAEPIKSAFVDDGRALLYDITPTNEVEGMDSDSWVSMLSFEIPICVNPNASL